MRWINFLHFYQPANLEKEKIIEAAEKSYSLILRRLENNPRVKFTANISGSLLIRLAEDLGQEYLVGRFKDIIGKGQLEITGTAAYHPIAPLIDKKIFIRQVKEQEELLIKYFGLKKPRGFFLPEMAYSPEIGRLIKKLGYEWIILDEISGGGRLGELNTSKVYRDKSSGLKVIFRSRYWSSSYVPKHFLEKWPEIKDSTIITATDAELYGLKHNDHSNNFKALLQKPDLKTSTISEYIASARGLEPVEMRASSWESSNEKLEDCLPFALWAKDDKIHEKLWKLARLAQKIYLKHERAEAASWSYWHLVRGLSSCAFWWASGQDFSHNFGPRAWSPDEIEKGVNELIRSIRSLEKLTDLKTKLKAERLAIEIKKLVWQKHWTLFNN